VPPNKPTSQHGNKKVKKPTAPIIKIKPHRIIMPVFDLPDIKMVD
jgi:hypothetical protein